uniref:Uncharacterized protein n=1 Tax=Salix viminalis TaxID=40686 RepID=A0A6N2LVC8_SALVM
MPVLSCIGKREGGVVMGGGMEFDERKRWIKILGSWLSHLIGFYLNYPDLFSERYGSLYLAGPSYLVSATVFFSGLYSSWDVNVSEAQIRSGYPTTFISSLLLAV